MLFLIRLRSWSEFDILPSDGQAEFVSGCCLSFPWFGGLLCVGLGTMCGLCQFFRLPTGFNVRVWGLGSLGTTLNPKPQRERHRGKPNLKSTQGDPCRVLSRLERPDLRLRGEISATRTEA